MGYLSTGKYLMPKVCDMVVKVMGDVIFSMNYGMLESNIGYSEREPSSYHYFKKSIESSQPNQIIYPIAEKTNATTNQPLVNSAFSISNDK